MLRSLKKSRAKVWVVSEAGPDAAPTRAVVSATSARARAASRAGARIGMCAVVFAAAFGALGVRLALVSGGGAGGGEIREIAARPEIEGRPEIVDRNGAILAANLPTIALEIAGREVWDPQETAAAVASVLPQIDAAALAEKLAARRYVEAATDISPAQQKEVFALGLPGVRFSSRIRRFYPQLDLAAHVVGHVEPGRGGVMGLERTLDTAGRAGALVASIDIRVQQALEDELTKGMKEFSAIAAWGGVLDVETGEVIALASLPDFDPNAPGAAQADWRRNRATYDRYELGSAMKTLTAAAALEAGTASEASSYDARGSLRIADRTINDFRGKNRVLSFAEVIEYSSNIGMARMAADLGAERQRAALSALGLFAPLPIELPERRDTEYPARWGPVETATISYGHGISITPLHLLASFAAVVNGGEYRAPTFLKAEAARPSARVFSERTSAIMRRVLRRVIDGGTASKADAPGYYPVGKTATAEKPKRGGYDKSARISSFVGAFPGHAPRYAVLISFDEPKPTPSTHGFATAGWNAAPAFARLVDRVAPALGVMPADDSAVFAALGPPRTTRAALAAGAAAPAGGVQ